MINLKFSLLIIILDSNFTSLKNKNFLENEERKSASEFILFRFATILWRKVWLVAPWSDAS